MRVDTKENDNKKPNTNKRDSVDSVPSISSSRNRGALPFLPSCRYSYAQLAAVFLVCCFLWPRAQMRSSLRIARASAPSSFGSLRTTRLSLGGSLYTRTSALASARLYADDASKAKKKVPYSFLRAILFIQSSVPRFVSIFYDEAQSSKPCSDFLLLLRTIRSISRTRAMRRSSSW